MRRTGWLLISALANVVLVVVLLVSRASGSLSNPPPASSHTDDDTAPTAANDERAPGEDETDPLGYFQYLRQLGLSVDETKPLIQSRLETQFLSAARPPTTKRYWESGFAEAKLTAEVALSEERERVRAALIEVYGTEAELDPVLWRAFRPLDATYGFLSSAQQVALQKYQLERQVEQAAQRATGCVHAALLAAAPSVRGPTARDRRSMAQELGVFLDPDAVVQVLYRYSPLGEQIRSSCVRFDETEFRETFAQLERLESGASGPATYVEVRDSLRRLLGPDRFTRLWAARDPLYAALAAAGSRLGLGEDTTLAAYQIFNDTQDTLRDASGLHVGDPERSRAEMQRALSLQRQKLSALVGPDVAERLLNVQSELVPRVSRQDTGAPRFPASTSGSGPPMFAGHDAPLPAR